MTILGILWRISLIAIAPTVVLTSIIWFPLAALVYWIATGRVMPAWDQYFSGYDYYP